MENDKVLNMIRGAGAVFTAALLSVSVLLSGCAAAKSSQPGIGAAAADSGIKAGGGENTDSGIKAGGENTDGGNKAGDDNSDGAEGAEIPVTCAKGFRIREYDNKAFRISIEGEEDFLALTEGAAVPKDCEDMAVIKIPVSDIYLAASGAMDMFIKAGALDSVKYCSTDEDGWYLDEAKAAMEKGNISYVGKYSEPDFEFLLDEGCHLAIENTMIYHKPQTMEKLKELGIPVIVDLASRENDPLGRMEWIKLYGILTGHYEDACEAFEKQVALAGSFSDTGKSVGFFYFASDGTVSVRRSDDYIPAMIKMAGGNYVFDDLYGDNELSTENIQMEDFYVTAKDADYLIYNGMITGDMPGIEELVAQNSLLADFRAVKEGHVYQASKDFYQSAMSIGAMINDIHLMLEDAEGGYALLKKLE